MKVLVSMFVDTLQLSIGLYRFSVQSGKKIILYFYNIIKINFIIIININSHAPQPGPLKPNFTHLQVTTSPVL